MTTTTMSPLVKQRFQASAATRKPLVDNMLTESDGFTEMKILEEATKKSGALIVEGEVGRYGKATKNKRFYGEAIMRREIKRLQSRIENRSLLAAVDHPTDGKSRICEAGAICVGLRVESDGRIIGKYEVVEESDGGRNLAAFLRRGCSIGMSSRGLGSTRLDHTNGHHVVGEDFKLHGFDFVADPACETAYPGLVSEDVNASEIGEDQLRATFGDLIESIEDRARQAGAEIAEDDVREKIEEEFKQALDVAGDKLRGDIKLQVEAEIREQLREDFAAKLIKALQEQREEVTAVVRSELLSDPSVAGAKRFMEELAEKLVPFQASPDQQVVMDDYEARIKTLREEIEENGSSIAVKDVAIQELVSQKDLIESQARGLGYRLYIERAISKHENQDNLREMIGDPGQFESADALREHVSAVINQVADAQTMAESQANSRLKVKEHKADLARHKAQIATEELDLIREEMDRKINGLSQRMNAQAREKNEVISEAADHIESLERELAQARGVAAEANLYNYASRRLVGHPRENDIMSLVDSGRVTSKAEVQRLAEEWDTQATEPGGVSERIRASLARGRERQPEELRQPSGLMEDRGPVPGFEGTNTTLGEIRALCGIGQDDTRRRF